MRLLGLDYGKKYVGVAISDPLGITGAPLETIYRKEENKLRKTYARIEEIVREYGIERIIVGLPKNMNNTEGSSAQGAKEFAADIERRTGIDVVMWDERLSTVSANRILMETGVRREDRKQVIDKIAAGIVLQNYLDYLSNAGQQDDQL